MSKVYTYFIGLAALGVAFLLWGLYSHTAGYNKRSNELLTQVNILERRALEEHLNHVINLGKVTENAIIEKQRMQITIDEYSNRSNSLSDSNRILTNRIQSSNRDATTLKRVATEVTGLLEQCQSEYKNLARDYRRDNSTTIELQARLINYEK